MVNTYDFQRSPLHWANMLCLHSCFTVQFSCVDVFVPRPRGFASSSYLWWWKYWPSHCQGSACAPIVVVRGKWAKHARSDSPQDSGWNIQDLHGRRRRGKKEAFPLGWHCAWSYKNTHTWKILLWTNPVWRGIFFCTFFSFFFLYFFLFLAGFGFWLLAFGFGFWLLASHLRHLVSGFWLLLASGFWLLLAFGFWLRASGFCGFWLGCNSAWILFIVCMALLQMLYKFFISSMSFFIFVWMSCNSTWVSFFCINYLYVFQPGFAASVASVAFVFFFCGFTILYLSICLSIQSIKPSLIYTN